MTLCEFINWCCEHNVPLDADITIRNVDGEDVDELISLEDGHLDYIWSNREIIIN